MEYYVGSILYSDDALQHYGVKGMKWGVRKSDNQTSNNSIRDRLRRKYKPTHEDLLKSKNPKQLYKHRDELSDYELKKKVDRLYNEKKLKDLYDSPQQKKGRSVANDIVKKTATTVVASVVTAAALYSAKNLMDKYYPGMSDFLKFKR